MNPSLTGINRLTAEFSDREVEQEFRDHEGSQRWLLFALLLMGTIIAASAILDFLVFVGPLAARRWQPLALRALFVLVAGVAALVLSRARRPAVAYWAFFAVSPVFGVVFPGLSYFYLQHAGTGHAASLLIYPVVILIVSAAPPVPFRFAWLNVVPLVISALVLHTVVLEQSAVDVTNLLASLTVAVGMGVALSYRTNRGKRLLYAREWQQRATNEQLGREVERRELVERELREHKTRLEALVGERTARLIESQDRYRLLAENSRDVIWTMGLDGRMTYVSPSIEALSGFTPAEFVVLSIEEQLTPESAQRVRARLAEELAKPADRRVSSVTMEVEQRHKAEPTSIPVETTVAWVRDQHGEPIGMQGATRDLRPRRQAEAERQALAEQLRQAQRMEAVGRLAAGVAHDLNNLLSPILGYSDLLLSRTPATAPAHEPLTAIHAAGERARVLTGRLLAFGRKRKPQMRSTDVAQVVHACAAMLRTTIREDIALEIAMPSGVGAIEADPAQLEQVLVNLVINARDAIVGRGAITVATGERDVDDAFAAAHPGVTPGRYVELTVTDTGGGIAPEHLARVFEPFFTTKEVGKGTGLGLAIAHGIVSEHGGRIWVESPPGQGASFHVLLPRAGAAAAAAVAPAAREAPVGGREVIMVVEDDRAVRELVDTMLRSLGYTTLTAADARECREVFAARDGAVDLLLSDVVMPGLNGFELYDELAKRYPALKVLFMSGYADEVVSPPRLGGVAPILQKPLSVVELARRLREVLDGGSPRIASSRG